MGVYELMGMPTYQCKQRLTEGLHGCAVCQQEELAARDKDFQACSLIPPKLTSQVWSHKQCDNVHKRGVPGNGLLVILSHFETK